MKSFLEHLSINVSNPDKSFPFYKDLFMFLGYKIIKDKKDGIAFRKEGTPDFWIKITEPQYTKNRFHRKNTGLNHLAFKVDSKEEVDDFFNKFIQAKNIKTLYATPKAFSEYESDYYAVFFEDPDRIKIEILYY
jgi:catechol 2,3-dioxygenase-like lactoylglutathione lyase family enzyme